MEIISLGYDNLRLKTAEKIKNYLSLSANNYLTIGLYQDGRLYVFGNADEQKKASL